VNDELEIETVVERAYHALAFDPGHEPDWARFNSVFSGSAVLALRLFPEDPAISVLTLDEYAVAQMQHDLTAQGYSETPGRRRVEITGDVATVRQEFTMNFSHRPPVPALDVFSLARVSGSWTVVAVVSDMTAAAPAR
jgi:hypothetical protein